MLKKRISWFEIITVGGVTAIIGASAIKYKFMGGWWSFLFALIPLSYIFIRIKLSGTTNQNPKIVKLYKFIVIAVATLFAIYLIGLLVIAYALRDWTF